MYACFKEIKSEYGLLVWICLLNGREVARSWSLPGAQMQVLNLIRKNQNGKST